MSFVHTVLSPPVLLEPETNRLAIKQRTDIISLTVVEVSYCSPLFQHAYAMLRCSIHAINLPLMPSVLSTIKCRKCPLPHSRTARRHARLFHSVRPHACSCRSPEKTSYSRCCMRSTPPFVAMLSSARLRFCHSHAATLFAEVRCRHVRELNWEPGSKGPVCHARHAIQAHRHLFAQRRTSARDEQRSSSRVASELSLPFFRFSLSSFSRFSIMRRDFLPAPPCRFHAFLLRSVTWHRDAMMREPRQTEESPHEMK